MSALTKTRALGTLVVPLAIAIGLSSQAHATVQYTITDLGALTGSSNSTGYAINNSGQVIGSYADATGSHGFLYSGGTMTTFAAGVSLNGINASGTVVGSNNGQAFVYSNGVMTGLSIWSGNSSANAINASGQITGSALLNGAQHAYLYDNGVVTDLFPLDSMAPPGTQRASGIGINDQGQVVGNMTTGGFGGFFSYDHGVLKSHGGDVTASDINNSGQIVGTDDASVLRAFVFQNNAYTLLPTLGGFYTYGRGINDAGDVVGSSQAGYGDLHAFLYTNGGISDLNDLIDPMLGWTLTDAADINDLGQIVGQGTIGGQTHAFVLTAVPAPAAAWLFGSGLAGLWGATRRRRD